MKKNKYIEIGLGIFLAGVRFRVKMERYKYGFGIRARHMIDLTLNASQKMFVEIWLETLGLEYQRTYSKKKDIIVILNGIESYADAVSDTKGMKNVQWLLDNPIPTPKEHTVEDLHQWVTRWDDAKW